MRRALAIGLTILLWACGGGGGSVTLTPDTGGELREPDTTAVDVAADETAVPTPGDVRDTGFELPEFDAADIAPLGCEPGEGCFLDECAENDECKSGWCLEHMGEGICTQACQDECPPGWSCKAIAGTEPDLVYVCASQHANLCKPCGTASDCKGTGGVDDVCVRYGDEGSFCGGACALDEDCPWGFSCQDVETVDGIATTQCVADAGVCPCTQRSVELALWTPCRVAGEAGVCEGKRVCTQDGLTACDALVPADEACNGIDDDCDGEVDEDTCDDGNECTADTCDGESGCVHEALDAGECKDGNPCTVADHCEAGVCVGNPVVCDDDNPCTDDFCDEQGGCYFENNTADCDDGDPCTVADECEAGVCAGTAVACDCLVDADCAALDDGDVCTGTLFCDTEKIPYRCAVVPDSAVVCPEPEGPGSICLKAACDPETGACFSAPDNEGAGCDDGNACTLGDQCTQGTCVAGSGALACNDSNPCTDDACDAQTGCAFTPNQAPCDDGNACTTGEACTNGACVADGLLDCDDANPCTKDTCHPADGCVHAIVAAPCDDGDACTVNDTCVNGECVSGPALVCNDQNPCTADSCGDEGCVHVPTDGACDDGNACTENDHCEGGQCVFEATLTCDDGDVCTTDSCDSAAGCQYKLNQAPCDDGDICTTGDHCHLGACISSGQFVCDDGNACTVDSCHPVAGCLFEPPEVPCDDGFFCNGTESCDPAVGCVAGIPPVLDDGVGCTADACDEDSDTVTHTPDDAACDDLLFCNGTETCDAQDGCVDGEPPALDDGVSCTVDACDEEADVVTHVPDNGLCDDDDECNGVETCDPVLDCVPGEPIVCDFDLENDKILLANGNYIKCFGGLTVTPAEVSCPYPLFNQENYGSPSQNTMLGLHNEGEQYAAGHAYIQSQIGVAVGYSGGREVKMNEGGLGGIWSGTGTHENEHCYHSGQVLNWKANEVCHGGLGGGSNVLSSFKLYK